MICVYYIADVLLSQKEMFFFFYDYRISEDALTYKQSNEIFRFNLFKLCVKKNTTIQSVYHTHANLKINVLACHSVYFDNSKTALTKSIYFNHTILNASTIEWDDSSNSYKVQ